VAVRALLLDFNGTISDDEPLLCAIFQELFAARGRPLSTEEYYERLAGLSDREIVDAWLGPGHGDVVAEKIAEYRRRAADGSTVPPEARAAVAEAAKRVPIVVVSGSARDEVESVLAAAGLGDLIHGLVASEDVVRGKPAPDGYRLGLELAGVRADEAVAVEDSDAGIAAAKAAGLRCVAVRGTMPPERLAGADEIVARLDSELVHRLLAC
jgi:HAD superfamily hydrolase (TIGR01509 family)